ncbi:MAG: PAS domain-containing protein [Gallionella sp.]
MPNELSELQTKRLQSVTRLLMVLAGSVFLIELLVMFLLDSMPAMPKLATFLLDSTLLSALIFPIFYFLVFRPLCQNIEELKRTEDDLRLVSLVFESKDPILITDTKGTILKANKAFLNYTGYKPADVIGKHTRMLKTGRYGKEYYNQMWGQLLNHGSWVGETRIKDMRGHEFPIGMVITAVKNEQKETTHYVAIYNL